jgi:hypothetical protein
MHMHVVPPAAQYGYENAVKLRLSFRNGEAFSEWSPPL